LDASTFFILVLIGSAAACLLGSLTGLGGGAVLTPLLVLVLGVDLRYAIGASLIAVIATSSGATATFAREGFTNIRVGVVLEVATVAGALLGAYIAGLVDKSTIAIVFSIALFWSAWATLRGAPPVVPTGESDALATRLRLASSHPTHGGSQPYGVVRVPSGLALMFGAGVLSALAGIGSGVIKVLAMDRVMRLPFKVSTTTSNFMIGVTAAASVGVYLHRGQIEPRICAPVVLGGLVGSMVGARLLPRLRTRWLRVIFAIVVIGAGVEMCRKAIVGGF
jgi:uncharacterized protein